MAFIIRYRVAIIFGLIKFILPYFLREPLYELHRDEYLYLAEAKHLAWGFMEVPPGLSLLAKLTEMLGNDLFWVKFWPSFFGALTILVVCEMVMEMGGRIFAQCIASISIIAGVYLRIHFLFQPNFLEIFWWSLLALFLVKYINTGKSSYILLLGIAVGMAWLSKYSIVFFVTGMIVGLLLTSERKVFLKQHIYWAALLALVIALPNILWQYNHNWPVVHHMTELRKTQLQFISPFGFLKDQLLMHLPSLFLWIGGLAWLLASVDGKPYRVLAWIYITVILLLTITSGKNYYTLGAYPMLFAAGAVWLETLTKHGMRWLRFASVAIIVLLFIPLIPLLLPVWIPDYLVDYYTKYKLDKTGALKWEDLQNHPLPQDFADMLGWKELTEKVTLAYQKLPDAEKNETMLHCRNYGQAGALTYYGKGLPQVNTDNGSFLFWMPESYQVKNILLVAAKEPDKDDIVFQQFKKYHIVDSISNPMSREFGTKIFLFEKGNEKLDSLIEESVRLQKAKFQR